MTAQRKTSEKSFKKNVLDRKKLVNKTHKYYTSVYMFLEFKKVKSHCVKRDKSDYNVMWAELSNVWLSRILSLAGVYIKA